MSARCKRYSYNHYVLQLSLTMLCSRDFLDMRHFGLKVALTKESEKAPFVLIRFSPVAFVLVAFLGLSLSIHHLFGFYEKRAKGIAKLGRSTVAKWDFELKDLGGFSYRLLIVFSVAGAMCL